MNEHKAVNWHPRAINILDYVGEDLITANGEQVLLRWDGKFHIYIGDEEPIITGDGLHACYILNQREVGHR